jgi:hypothetical protein
LACANKASVAIEDRCRDLWHFHGKGRKSAPGSEYSNFLSQRIKSILNDLVMYRISRICTFPERPAADSLQDIAHLTEARGFAYFIT